MGLHFDIVDVFTDRAYTGNPLAVVHLGYGGGRPPRTECGADASWPDRSQRALTTAQMQAIAREFNLSETAFTMPPTTSRATYKLRIFTPARELPFAGHPSIGAAWALGFADMIRRGDVVQECGAGLLPVRVDAAGARVSGGAPEVGPDLPGDALARTVGLDPGDLDPGQAAGVASAGVPFAFLPVGPDAVARAEPDPAAIRASLPDLTGLVVIAVDRETWRVHARVFCPQVGVVEDPATGSAGVALAVFLAGRGVLPEGSTTLVVEQGAEMGRPSRLEIQVRVAGGVAAETAVRGGVRMVAKGELLALPDA